MKTIFIALFSFLFLSGCGVLNGNLKKANDNEETKRFAQQLAAGINADTLAADIIKGITAGLDDPKVKAQVQDFISAILTQTGSVTGQQIDSLKIILFATLDQLTLKLSNTEDTLLGKHLQLLIHNLKTELLGKETNQMIAQLINNIKDSLLNDDTRFRLGELRDELLGDKTNRLVSTIVDSAVSVAMRKSGQGIKQDTGIIKKFANQILYTLGGIIAALLGFGFFIWKRKQHYASIIKSLTLEIEKAVRRLIKKI